MLRRYAPTERLETLDLDNTRIVLQRTEYIHWSRLSDARISAKAWTIEREKHKSESCLLILRNSSVWDAETAHQMLDFNQEFSVLDADGVRLRTTIRFVKGDDGSPAKNVVEIPTGAGETYYVDTYTYGFIWSRSPVASPIGEPATYVVYDEEGARWFAPDSRVGIHTLELVDRKSGLF